MGNISTKYFARRLREAMDRKKITASQLSKQTGISQSLISRYLSGGFKAKQNNLLLLSRALDVTPDYLMGYGDAEFEKELRAEIQRLFDALSDSDKETTLRYLRALNGEQSDKD